MLAPLVFCNEEIQKTEKIEKNDEIEEENLHIFWTHDEFWWHFWEKCHTKIHKRRELHPRKYVFEETIGWSNFNFKVLGYWGLQWREYHTI